jgi:hypothetical protein
LEAVLWISSVGWVEAAVVEEAEAMVAEAVSNFGRLGLSGVTGAAFLVLVVVRMVARIVSGIIGSVAMAVVEMVFSVGFLGLFRDLD